jgi:hypothetical protein
MLTPSGFVIRRGCQLVGQECAIKLGVERRVVVHLHLAESMEGAESVKNLPQQRVERSHELLPLKIEDPETGGRAGPVLPAGGGPPSLLEHVVSPQLQNGKPVEGGCGGLGGSECPGRGGYLPFGQNLGEEIVHGLDGVVARLVVAIDGSLHRRHRRVAGGGRPSQIFLVPEEEVPSMERRNPILQAAAIDLRLRVMPPDHEFLEPSGEFSDADGRGGA